MAALKITQKLQTILTDLQSTDETKVSKAIKSLESNGNAHVIKPLADLLSKTESDKVKSEILELLSSLKDTTIVV